MRYNLSKNDNLISYNRILDKNPAIWIDVLNYLNATFDQAIKANKNG